MFKLVCGAGNEDAESVKRLVYVYSSAGCKLFDLSARKEILAAAKEGVSISKATGVKYCVSVGIKGDRHISKAVIEYDKCTNCAVCNNICPNDALNFEEKPVIFLYSPTRITAIRKKFENVFPSPLSGLLYNLDELYIKTSKCGINTGE